MLLSRVLLLTARFFNPGTAGALPKALRKVQELGSIELLSSWYKVPFDAIAQPVPSG